MKLYYSPGACSMASHILLHETGAKHQSDNVDMKTKKTASGEDFNQVNPKSQVPTLKTNDGQILTESAVVLQYISEQHPEKNLLPKWGTWERFKANEWLNYVATEIHKGMGILFAVDRMVAHPQGKEELRKSSVEAMGKKFDYLSKHLKENQFMLGQQFSAVDAYLFTILNWHGFLKVDMTKWPTLMGYMEKVKSRPSVQAAMKAEGLI
jgi:glutathione S-transferase